MDILPSKRNNLENTTVLLRYPTQDDYAEFCKKVYASESLHHPWIYPPSNKTDFTAYLQRNLSDDHKHFLVCLAKTNEIAGVINVSHMIRGFFNNAFLGFYCFSDYARKGYMSQALTLIKQYAFHKLELHRLEANIQPTNAASIALVTRCGFSYEGLSKNYLYINGEWRDHARYAITKD